MNRPIRVMAIIMVILLLGSFAASAQPAAQGFSSGELTELHELEETHALEQDVVGGQWAETDVTVWVIGAVAITGLFLVLY